MKAEVRTTERPDIDLVEVTMKIPYRIIDEEGPAPNDGEISYSGIAIDHDHAAGWQNSQKLNPEGMAMYLMRIAWHLGWQEIREGK